MGRLGKPGAGLSSPEKESAFAFMSLMGLFIMPPPSPSGQSGRFYFEESKLTVHFQALLKKLLSRDVRERAARRRAINTATHYSCVSRVATAYPVRV